MWPSGLPLLNLKQGGHIRRTMVRIACDNKCTFISMNEAQFCLVRWLKFRERFTTVVQFEPCWNSWITFYLFWDNSAEITNTPCHHKIFLFSRCWKWIVGLLQVLQNTQSEQDLPNAAVLVLPAQPPRTTCIVFVFHFTSLSTYTAAACLTVKSIKCVKYKNNSRQSHITHLLWRVYPSRKLCVAMPQLCDNDVNEFM